ncbi:FbpB family small basic protein [Bacillus niameyensis]|nr:FbpB family small basic protein [Bacillus niameyensis]
MRRNRKKSFLDLVKENKEALLNDSKAMKIIETRLEEKHSKRA